MNEVRSTQPIVQPAVNPSSSKRNVSSTETQSGHNLPEEASIKSANAAPQVKRVSVEELESEVLQVNKYVQNVQRDLQFSIDEDLDRTVVRVVDSDTGELIRQIPDDIFLELARRLKTDGEMNLLNTQG